MRCWRIFLLDFSSKICHNLSMKLAQSIPKSLVPILWDVSQPEKIDTKKYQNFIIARVAEKGRWADVLWLKKAYGVAAIKRVVARSRNVSKITKNFWRLQKV